MMLFLGSLNIGFSVTAFIEFGYKSLLWTILIGSSFLKNNLLALAGDFGSSMVCRKHALQHLQQKGEQDAPRALVYSVCAAYCRNHMEYGHVGNWHAQGAQSYRSRS
jgi:hypothetical protein